jgi:RNA polymerase sigma-70 factor, ECF subfamily
MPASDPPVTRLLAEWSAGGSGSDAALAQLSSVLYAELQRLAQRHLRRERPDHTIQRTALVNEAFLRLVDQRSVDWQNRAHFLGLASTLMRRILVDHARARHADKRGGGAEVVSLDELASRTNDEGRRSDGDTPTALQHHDAELHDDVVAIDRALGTLATLDAQQAKVVEMRYFAGLTIEETADALGISPATVKREWVLARAWLRREVAREP